MRADQAEQVTGNTRRWRRKGQGAAALCRSPQNGSGSGAAGISEDAGAAGTGGQVESLREKWLGFLPGPYHEAATPPLPWQKAGWLLREDILTTRALDSGAPGTVKAEGYMLDSETP